MIKALLNLLFPQKCIGCRAEEGLLCKRCYQDIGFSPYLSIEKSKFLVYFATRKNLLLKKIIHRFKYNYKEEVGEVLGELLFKALSFFKKNFDDIVFVPIPIHYSKKYSRGFNQTEILSDYLSKKTNCPAMNLILKTRSGLVQASLCRKERILNVKNAFVINQKILKSSDLSKKIILIDDIMTTGATLENAYLVLKKSGFIDIEALVLCHGL